MNRSRASGKDGRKILASKNKKEQYNTRQIFGNLKIFPLIQVFLHRKFKENLYTLNSGSYYLLVKKILENDKFKKTRLLVLKMRSRTFAPYFFLIFRIETLLMSYLPPLRGHESKVFTLFNSFIVHHVEPLMWF